MIDPEKEIRDNPDKELTPEETLEMFKRSRNEALLSLNEGKIRTFFKFWNDEEMTPDPKMFWLIVHKAITGCKDLPKDFRQRSKFWLNTRGSDSEDDGDL
jgi:hypothetical protein